MLEPNSYRTESESGGWFAKLTHLGPDFGDLDTGYLKDYAETLCNGEMVIAVTAKLGDKRREIAELLKTTELEAVASEGIRT